MIDLEGIATWPEPVLKRLTDSLEGLRNYERRREQIDLAAINDIRLRFNPPHNPFRKLRGHVLQEIDDLLEDAEVLGFHCTRLHPDEINSIKRDGLEPLSCAKLSRRIHERMKAGEIRPDLGKRLLVKHQADDDNRRGMIWFVNSRSILTDHGGLFRLFRYWGGESLYRLHEWDPETGPLLRSIGVPVIVVAALPIRKYQITTSNIGDKIISSFLRKNGIRTERSSELEGHMQEPVLVRKIIVYGDPRFESLTRCNSWPDSIV